MSLAFLAKKSWHTANLKNVEKVWIAEQKHKEEEGRLSELKKQIAEEREQQELRDLQRRSGHGGKVAQEKVGWMYDGPMATCASTQDDQLLGQAAPQALTEAPASEVKQLASQPGSLYTNARAVDDSFSRVHEDPMLMMRQREIEARKAVLQNPRQMQRLRAQAQSERATERDQRKVHKRDKKREKKEKKKEKKREKKDRKKDQKRARKEQRHGGGGGGGGGGGSSSSSDADDDGGGSSSGSDGGADRYRGGARRSVEQRARTSSPPQAAGRAPGGAAARPAAFEKKAGYGLLSGSGQSMGGGGGGGGGGKDDRNLGPRNLGPSAASLERARGAGSEAASRKRPREHERAAPLTVEQKQARLAQMAADAGANEDLRARRIKSRVEAAGAEEQGGPHGGGGGDASFLRDMEKDVYLKEGGSMAERVQTTRFYQQRDTASDGFRR
jgi:uncharacterized membrane protein YgcG